MNFSPYVAGDNPPCPHPLRVLVLQHVQDDTYAVIENGDVSLSDKASLTLLLKELSGRDHP